MSVLGNILHKEDNVVLIALIQRIQPLQIFYSASTDKWKRRQILQIYLGLIVPERKQIWCTRDLPCISHVVGSDKKPRVQFDATDIFLELFNPFDTYHVCPTWWPPWHPWGLRRPPRVVFSPEMQFWANCKGAWLLKNWPFFSRTPP